VKPLTSQKSTVTVFRCSRAGETSTSGVPQASQKRAPARLSVPHPTQTTP
jgi:hypothetical protein